MGIVSKSKDLYYLITNFVKLTLLGERSTLVIY